jgi:Protein of unknown function (DUF2975)
VRPETEMKLSKVRRVSAVLRAVCKGLFVLTALVFAAASAGVFYGSGVTISYFDLQIPVEPLELSGRLVLVAVLALSAGVAFKGLHHLDRLLRNYAAGEIFTTQSARQIRQLGITLILWAGVNVIWVIAAHSLTRPQPPTSFELHLDSLITGIIVIVISWFMDAAAEMREENDLTI